MNKMLVFSYIRTEIINMVYFWQAGIYSQKAYLLQHYKNIQRSPWLN